MSWQFSISRGLISFTNNSGQPPLIIGTAYSGAPGDVDNPADVAIADHGPIPPGSYTILAPVDDPTVGVYALALIPDVENDEYGRGDFYIHGDLIDGPPMSASHGCIITGRAIRRRMWNSGDHRLIVVT